MGQTSLSESGWESVGGSASASVVIEGSSSARTDVGEGERAEPSVADARDLVTGERSGKRTKEELEVRIRVSTLFCIILLPLCLHPSSAPRLTLST